MNIIKNLILIMTTVFLFACSGKPAIKDGHLETIAETHETNPSFFSGSIAPVNTVVITSPADGVILDMPFEYGEVVKKDQLLFMLSSTKFFADYKNALMQYIKAKNEFDTGKMQLKEAEFLHKNELISDDDYKNKTSAYYANQLSLLQAKDALEILIRQLNIKNVNLYNLTIADIDKINQAMHFQKGTENIRISAIKNGVALSSNKIEEDAKKLNKGDAVKQGDVLLVIGDMSGLSIKVKVNELTVNQLKVGQKVKVTGIAFPEFSLNGEVKHLDHQGELSNNGLPQFPVEIVVNKLSPAEQQAIHVGMSAQVEIADNNENKVMVPITAVKQNETETYVRIYDKLKKKIHEVKVKTGKTTADKVAILQGLKAGDNIVVPD